MTYAHSFILIRKIRICLISKCEINQIQNVPLIGARPWDLGDVSNLNRFPILHFEYQDPTYTFNGICEFLINSVLFVYGHMFQKHMCLSQMGSR